MAEALYRKYRPQIFEDVVGQEHIERTIKNAIAQDKVSHAYLFCGPRGTGKTTTARLLAKALLCEHGPTAEPDGTCEDCRLIAAGEHPDVYELDAASRTGVENVREEIIGRVQFAPTRGRYKVYIIDEVHMLSTAAFNALLKTLEEPPSHVVFILATTDPQKVPETIHSRCQRFDFRRISTEAMVSRLGAICVAEGVEFEGEALDLVAHRAEGGMRNALTSLEQLIAFGEGAVTMEAAERMLGSVDSTDLADIVKAIGQRDAAAGFRWVADYVETGADLAQFTIELATHFRNMYVLAVAGSEVALEVSDTTRRELEEELPLFGADRLARLLALLGDVTSELKTATNPRLTFEIALARMVRPAGEVTLASLAERVEALERQLAGACVVTASEASGVSATPATPDQATLASAANPPASPAPSVTPAQATPAPAVNPPASSATSATPATPPSPSAPATNRASSSVASVPASASPSLQSDGVTLAPTAQLANPAYLQRLWAGALASLKKASAAHGVLFMSTKALYDAASGTLVIEFPAENDFVFRTVQKPEVQEELARALSHEAHGPIPFVLRKAGQTTTMPASVSAPVASTSSQGHPQTPPSPSQEVSAFADDVVPYDDAPFPEDIPPYDDADIPFPERTSMAVSDHADAPSAPAEPDDGDLNASLAFGFGEGVSFEEVL